MTHNTLLGLLLMFVGANDIVLARLLGDRLKLSPIVRTALTIVGLGLLAAGAVLALGLVRIL